VCGVCVSVCVDVVACLGGWVCTTKTPDRNDLKLGIAVVFDTLSQTTDFGLKRTKLRIGFMVRVRV